MHIFLDLVDLGSCNSLITSGICNTLLCRSRWPSGKVFVVKGRPKEVERLLVVVPPIQGELLYKPRCLVSSVCCPLGVVKGQRALKIYSECWRTGIMRCE